MRKDIVWGGWLSAVGLGTMMAIASAPANASLICVGAGNEFGDSACDFDDFGLGLTSASDLTLLAKDEAPATNPGVGGGGVAGVEILRMASNTEGVQWESTAAISANFDAGDLWVEKADSWYAVYSYMGPLAASISTAAFSDEGLARGDSAFTSRCESLSNVNCRADTSHVSLYDVAGGGGGPGNSVPEPAALGLMGLGMLGMGMARWRRRTQKRV